MSEADLGREIGRLRVDVAEAVRLLQSQGSMLQRVDFEGVQVAKMAAKLNEDFQTHVMDPTGQTGLVVRMRHLEANLRQLDEMLADEIKNRDAQLQTRKEVRQYGWRGIVVPFLTAVIGAILTAGILVALKWNAG